MIYVIRQKLRHAVFHPSMMVVVGVVDHQSRPDASRCSNNDANISSSKTTVHTKYTSYCHIFIISNIALLWLSKIMSRALSRATVRIRIVR